MNIFIISFVAALVSGMFAKRADQYRSTAISVCVASAVMAVSSGIRLIPEAVWIAFAPYIRGTLLVASFWALRTQIRNVLLKA